MLVFYFLLMPGKKHFSHGADLNENYMEVLFFFFVSFIGKQERNLTKTKNMQLAGAFRS